MSDDMVNLLRDLADRAEYMPHMHHVAANRIEKLQAQRNFAQKQVVIAEVKLAKALEALDEAIYLLDPDEEDIAKETGLHRIVAICAELKGEK
jgi:hypothetical protein